MGKGNSGFFLKLDTKLGREILTNKSSRPPPPTPTRKKKNGSRFRWQVRFGKPLNGNPRKIYSALRLSDIRNCPAHTVYLKKLESSSSSIGNRQLSQLQSLQLSQLLFFFPHRPPPVTCMRGTSGSTRSRPL